MKLSELYQERMAANPELTRKMLVDAVGSATVYAVQHDVPRKFRKGTLQKLAELWKCSTGDIQACLAEIDDPRRKPSKETTVMETVDKLEQMVDLDPEGKMVVLESAEQIPLKLPVLKPLTDGPSYTDELREHIVNIINSFDPDRPVREMWEEIGRFAARELL